MLANALAIFLLFVQFVNSDSIRGSWVHVNVVVVRVFSTCVLLGMLKVFCYLKEEIC